MTTNERPKHPGRVLAGQRRQQQLRDQLGEAGYAAYQRERRADALARHPDLQQRAATAANAAQRHNWGAEGYRTQRQEAYAAAVARHGRAAIQRHILSAQEQRRRHRLAHPTRGEAILRTIAASLGFHVILPQTPFDYLAWRENPTTWPEITSTTAIAEATVGRYCCDLLFPAHGFAVEVLGGVHCLQQEYDARRRAALEGIGLAIIELSDTRDEPLTELRVKAALLQLLHTWH